MNAFSLFVLLIVLPACAVGVLVMRGYGKRESLGAGVIRNLSPVAERSNIQMISQTSGIKLQMIEEGPNSRGEARGFPVSLTYVSNQELHVVCETQGAAPRVFQLAHEGFLESDDLRTGDAAFDRSIRLKGPDRVVAALMSRELRPLILRLAKRAQLDVKDGTITAVMKGDLGGPDRAAHVLRDVVSLARGLSMTAEDAGERLAARAADHKENPNLRSVALKELARRWPERLLPLGERLGDSPTLHDLWQQLVDQQRQDAARKAGAGGELAVVEAQGGQLSEATQGRVTLKKN
jgi:hypothetical protein